LQIVEIAGSSSEIVFESLPVDDSFHRQPDISYAKETIGWQPGIGLEEGLMRTAKCFPQFAYERAQRDQQALRV
jgi:UDP-glucuronate decarboxylase